MTMIEFLSGTYILGFAILIVWLGQKVAR